jgi:hypothetical protein
MGSGNTLLTLAAFMLLSSVIVNFYELTGNAGDAISSGQDGIFLSTLTTSYVEMAQGMAFDNITDTSHVAIANAYSLTSPTLLGPEYGEDSLAEYNDFDDFNGLTLTKEAGTSNRRYRTEFKVFYVDVTDLEKVMNSRTFAKRLDMKTYRTFPASQDPVDTLRASFVMGYFHFD